MGRSSRLAALTAALLAASLAVAACGTNGGTSGASGGDGKSLKLWHYEADNSAMGIAWNAAIKEFKAKHPGVTVKFEAKSFDQMQKNAPLILNSSSVPDVMEYNKGNATAGILSKQGLLTDLSSFAKKNGWDKSLSTGIQTTAKYDAQGLMGSGKWYGVPNYGEYVMVFYNKDMFAKYGVQVPTTLADFEKALATFKSKGITPISNAAAEYPAQQIFYELALSHADRSWVDDYERYTKPVDFHGAPFTYAADTMSKWVKKGYIAQNSAGLKAEGHGGGVGAGQVPDHDLWQLVVRPVRLGDQGLPVGHVPVPRQHPQRRLERQPVGGAGEGEEQDSRRRLHQDHDVEEDPEPDG